MLYMATATVAVVGLTDQHRHITCSVLKSSDWLIGVCDAANQPTVPTAASDMASDVSVAKEAAGFVEYVRRAVRRLLHSQTLMTSCVKHLM